MKLLNQNTIVDHGAQIQADPAFTAAWLAKQDRVPVPVARIKARPTPVPATDAASSTPPTNANPSASALLIGGAVVVGGLATLYAILNRAA